MYDQQEGDRVFGGKKYIILQTLLVTYFLLVSCLVSSSFLNWEQCVPLNRRCTLWLLFCSGLRDNLIFTID
jgi:hypothetical protein